MLKIRSGIYMCTVINYRGPLIILLTVYACASYHRMPSFLVVDDRAFHKYGLLIARQLLQATTFIARNGSRTNPLRERRRLFVRLQPKIAIVRPYVWNWPKPQNLIKPFFSLTSNASISCDPVDVTGAKWPRSPNVIKKKSSLSSCLLGKKMGKSFLPKGMLIVN